ncbi:unnamed protein product [Blumeria hordei]|uniref:UBX domain-containing protein 2 n=1 Tax=Blumeria hordei TaxID=2867405 RepID=A0A383UJK6_BLUHO|nr:unnamed protein product [Blumeria hordei]
MNYRIDLQDAISEAVRESKLVACFVTDNGQESQLWENEFIQDQELKEILSNQSILLKLEAGSTEADYLAAIVPLPKTPTFVVIKNGRLMEYLTTGVKKEDFVRRLLPILQAENSRPLSITSTPISTPVPTQVPSPTRPTSQGTQVLNSPETSFQSRLDERTDKDRTIAAGPNSGLSPAQPASADQTYALMQKKRQKEARDERARILKRVEEDKITRRHEAARRKAERDRSTTNSKAHDPSLTMINTENPPLHPDTCALLIRLFDGSTLRTKFSCTATLSNEVRKYISQHQPSLADQPYDFKHVLSPLPNRKIEAAEESRTLRELGCVPSATLILAPVKSYAEAYSNNSATITSSGLIEGVVGNGWRVVSGGLGMVTGVLGAFMGAGGVHDRAESAQYTSVSKRSTPSVSTPRQTSRNLRTLDDSRSTDDQQFYNGNSVSFQPRPKDSSGEEKK